MRIYVAGSWRMGGARLDVLIHRLRKSGHDVFDFREESSRAAWEEELMTARAQAEALGSDDARTRWEPSRKALEEADVIVLVEPAGRNAHLEAGWAAGRGKPVVVWLCGDNRPELALRLLGRPWGHGAGDGALVDSFDDVARRLGVLRAPHRDDVQPELDPKAALEEAQAIARETWDLIDLGLPPSMVEVNRLCDLVRRMPLP